MKYSTIIGLVLIAVGLLLYIIQEPSIEYDEFYIGGILGLGLGLLFGGFMGYAQKKRTKVVSKQVLEKKGNNTILEERFESKNPDDESGLKL